jgi:uncharacterized membrane-anchored protein
LQAAGADGDATPPRLCRLMAEIEEAQNGDLAASRVWLERAANSTSPDPAYACNACGGLSPSWAPLCPHCRSFDALVWRARPGERASAAAFLPASIDDQSRAVVGSAAIRFPLSPT